VSGGKKPAAMESERGSWRSGLLGVAVVAVLMVIGMGIAITPTVIGAVSLDQCQIDVAIPIWLILMGIMPFLNAVHKCISDAQTVAGSCCSMLIGVLDLGVFIMGHVVVYRALHDGVQFDDPLAQDGCSRLCFYTAAGIIFVTDASIGLGLIGACVALCITCCIR